MNMHYYTLPIISTKKLVLATLLLLSVLLAAYGPMASYSQAQSVASGKLQELKDKALTEINRRITSYEKTMSSLNVDVRIAKDGSTANVSSDKGTASGSASKDGIQADATGTTNGSNVSFTFGKDGITGNVSIPSTSQDKVKAFTQKMIDQLKGLKDKVTSATSLESLQNLAKNIEAQFNLDQLTQVQAAATQAVESMTGVLDKIKTAYNNLQTGVNQMKECMNGVKSGDESIDAHVDSQGATVNCGDLNLSSSNVVDQSQSMLDGLKSVISTIASVVATVVTLLLSLVTQFTGLLSSLGSLGSLGNLGNLSNLLDGGQLSSLTGSSGNIGNMLNGFSSIISQLGVAQGMSGNVQGMLTTILGNLPNIISTVGGAAGLGDISSSLSNAQGGLGGLGLSNLTGSGGFGSGNTSSDSNATQVGTKGDWTGSRGGATFTASKRGTNCVVDYSRAPALQQNAGNWLTVCENAYSKMKSLLDSYTYHTLPIQVMLIPASFSDAYISKDSCAPMANGGRIGARAVTTAGRIYVCADTITYFQESGYDNSGSISHEMVHLMQTPKGQANSPNWVMEGIPDYVRTTLGYDMSFSPPGCTSIFKTYLDGYKCADALFIYIARVYNPNIAKNVHKGMNTGNYTDSMVTSGTGRTLIQLYNECLQAECKGGSPL